jgi:hypothetical protein
MILVLTDKDDIAGLEMLESAHGMPAPKMIGRLVSHRIERFLGWCTAEEKLRFLAKQMTPAEAKLVWKRSRAPNAVIEPKSPASAMTGDQAAATGHGSTVRGAADTVSRRRPVWLRKYDPDQLDIEEEAEAQGVSVTTLLK